MKQTVEELENKLELKEALEVERKKSNDIYAIKLVEVLVFGFVGLILVAAIGALIKLVIIG